MSKIKDFEKRLNETSNKVITGIIYKYTSPSNKVYIGQTTSEIKRRNSFRNRESYGGIKIDNARRKYNPDNFKYDVISRKNYLSEEDANFDLDLLETYYIADYDSYKNGYNSTTGGDGTRGVIVSEETRKRMSESLKGLKKTEEHRYKISLSHKGKKLSEETKRKLSDYHIGKRPTDDARKKMSESRKGEKNCWYRKCLPKETLRLASLVNSKSVISLTVNNEYIKEYNSIRQAGKETGVDTSSISRCCKGKQKIAGGYKWKYSE